MSMVDISDEELKDMSDYQIKKEIEWQEYYKRAGTYIAAYEENIRKLKAELARRQLS